MRPHEASAHRAIPAVLSRLRPAATPGPTPSCAGESDRPPVPCRPAGLPAGREPAGAQLPRALPSRRGSRQRAPVGPLPPTVAGGGAVPDRFGVVAWRHMVVLRRSQGKISLELPQKVARRGHGACAGGFSRCKKNWPCPGWPGLGTLAQVMALPPWAEGGPAPFPTDETLRAKL